MKTAYQIGKEVVSAATAPMTIEQSKVFLTLSLAGPDFTINDDAQPLPFPLQVFDKRVVHYDIDVEDRVTMILCMIAHNVGEVVMFVAAVWYLEHLNGREVTLDDLVEAFPMGFPTHEALSEIWDNQKVSKEESANTKGDNWIDQAAAWQKPVKE